MRRPTDQQRVIKGELRQARDLLVAEFLCEIGSDNGDIETGTPRLVRLNILLSTLPPSCVYTFPEMREYFQRKLDSDRNLSLLIELGAIRLITSSLDPDSSSVVTVGSQCDSDSVGVLSSLELAGDGRYSCDSLWTVWSSACTMSMVLYMVLYG